MKRLLVPIVCLAFLTAACTSNNDTSPSGSASSGGASAELTVFAASSLTAAFKQIGKDFQTANPGTTVTFNFGPSDGLAAQIESEGTADVFASASGTWMDDVQKKTGVTGRVDFAQNGLVVITPTDNPANIETYADLADPGVQLVLAAPGVPVGDYARESLKSAGLLKGVTPNIVSNEEDEASVVAKVTAGEADAGIVYVSSVSSDVDAVEIPADVNVIATCPIAMVAGSSNGTLAQAFVDYVTGSEGQATLHSFQFLPPPTA